MTKKELQARCKAEGIKGYSRFTVAQLIEALDGIGEKFEYADPPTDEDFANLQQQQKETFLAGLEQVLVLARTIIDADPPKVVDPNWASNIADVIAFAGNSRAQQAFRKTQKALRFEKLASPPTDPVSRIVTAIAFAHPKVRKAYRRALRLPKRLRQQAAALVA